MLPAGRTRRGLLVITAAFWACTSLPAQDGHDLAFPLKGTVDRKVAFRWIATPPGDTLHPPLPLGRTEIVQRAADYQGKAAVLQILSVPAWDWHDTLLVLQATLHPVWEHARAHNRVIRVDVAGGRIRWRTTQGDSVLSQGDSTHVAPAFAFNQVEMLVRSVPLEAGRTVVVPLYSEGRPDVEADTIGVMGGPAGGGSTWLVRFADAAMYTLYRIDGSTREIIGTEVVYRPTGTKYRRLPAGERP